MKHLKKIIYLLLTITLIVSCEKETVAEPEIFNQDQQKIELKNLPLETGAFMNEIEFQRILENSPQPATKNKNTAIYFIGYLDA